LVGLVLEVRRAGVAKNSRVEVKIIRERGAVTRDISALVGSFGLDPILDAEVVDLPRLGVLSG